MTFQDTLIYGRKKLEDAGIRESALDAWYLLEYICGFDRTFYLMHQKDEIKDDRFTCYQEMIEKRCNRIPLQHLTGQQEFMGFNFRVNKDVLIPRQDTEILVEEVLNCLTDKMTVLDMCTGCGCILISLLKLKEGTCGLGVDLSEKALVIARDNGIKNGLSVEFRQSDLFEKVTERYDCIVSNPPYIRTEVIHELMTEVREHEPSIALDGGADGLSFYKKIICESSSYLKPKGRLFFEIGFDQGQEVSDLMKNAGYCHVRIIKDLAGLDRVVSGRLLT